MNGLIAELRNRRVLKMMVVAFAAACISLCLGACGTGDAEGEPPADEGSGTEELEDPTELGDYTIKYLQDGPLVKIYGNKENSKSDGVIDPKGKIIAPSEYEIEEYAGADRYVVSKGEKDEMGELVSGGFGIIDTECNDILPCEYAEIYCGEENENYGVEYDEDLLPAKKNGDDLFGFISRTDGRTVIEPRFKDAGIFSEDLAPVQFDDGKWGYIDENGNTVIEAAYDDAGSFDEGLAIVRKDNRAGVIDKDGRQQLSCKEKNSYIIDCTDDMAVIDGENEGEYVVVDSRGNATLTVRNAEAFDDILLVGDLIQIRHRGEDRETMEDITEKSELYNKDGKEIYKGRFAEISVSFDRLIVQDRKTKKYGLLDASGKEIIPCEYYDMSFLHQDINTKDYEEYEDKVVDDLIFLQKEKDGPCFIGDENGKPVNNKKYDAIGDFSENGRAAVIFEEKIGFIDESGSEVIPCDYVDCELARNDGDGEYDVEEGEEFNKEKGHLKGHTAFFHNGLAAVSKETYGNYAFIDETGKEVTEYVYGYAIPIVKESIDFRDHYFSDLIYAGVHDEKSVLIDKDGNERIVSDKNRDLDMEVIEYGNGLLPVKEKEEGPWALMDRDGNIVTDFIFDIIFDNA